MNGLQIRIASDDPRLKRHINHDPESARYEFDTSGLSVVDIEWPCHLDGVLDQGNVGACTAEAADEILASDPFWATLSPTVKTAIGSATQDWPLAFYHDETEADDYPGTYPPTDTGSDGLTSAKVAKARGLIAGYTHTFTPEDALKALGTQPGSWGTLWKTGMDAVNTDTGQVRYTGTTRGGHQLCVYKINAAREQVWFRQSWGAWGYHNGGVAWISFDDFAASLADQGDVTFFVPRTDPAPTPTPPPTPSTYTDAAIANYLRKHFLGRFFYKSAQREVSAWINANHL